jgi:hypothetical protein
MSRSRTTSEILELVDQLDKAANRSHGRQYPQIQKELRAAYKQAAGELDPGQGTPDDEYRTLSQADILKGVLDAYFGGTE